MTRDTKKLNRDANAAWAFFGAIAMLTNLLKDRLATVLLTPNAPDHARVDAGILEDIYYPNVSAAQH